MSSSRSAPSTSSEPSSLPSELVSPVSDFDRAVKRVSSEVVSPLLASGSTRADLVSGLTPLERAKVDLASAFAANSLAWMWLKTKGEDPAAAEVKTELDRVRSALKRLKETEVRLEDHPRVDREAAKRFVRSGLWQPDKDKDNRKRVRQQESEQQRGRGRGDRGKRGRK